MPGAPVVAVSARTGAGLDELRAALAAGRARRGSARRATAPTRLYVDRVVHAARHRHRRDGDALVGLDRRRATSCGSSRAGRPVRVRSVQVHDRPVERAEPGQRVAVALPGVERRRAAARRRARHAGRVLGRATGSTSRSRSSRRSRRACTSITAPPSRAARVVRVGERWAQLRLAAPVVAARGDRVVLRAGTTVGGGRRDRPGAAASRERGADGARRARRDRGDRVRAGPRRVVPPPRRRRDRGPRGRPATGSSPRRGSTSSRTELERRIAGADPLDPGVAPPPEPWAPAVVPLLGLERRGAKLYLPGADRRARRARRGGRCARGASSGSSR